MVNVGHTSVIFCAGESIDQLQGLVDERLKRDGLESFEVTHVSHAAAPAEGTRHGVIYTAAVVIRRAPAAPPS